MSGRRLLLCLSRKKAIFQSVYVCTGKHTWVHLDWKPMDNCAFMHRKEVLPGSEDRVCSHLLHRKFSSCSERVPSHGEGPGTLVLSQQDSSHDTAGYGIIKQKEDPTDISKSRRKKQVKDLQEKECKVLRRSSILTRQLEDQDKAKIDADGQRESKSASDIGPDESISSQSMPSTRTIANINAAKKALAYARVSEEDNLLNSTEQASSMPHGDNSILKNDGGKHHGKSKHEREISPKIPDFSDFEEVFKVLLIPKQSGLQKPERDALARVFKHFLEAGWASEAAQNQCYISSVLFPVAVSSFRKFFFSRCTPDIKAHLLCLGPSVSGDQFLFPLFLKYSNMEFPGEIARYKALVETADLTKPHTWFPFARAVKRKIVYHSGPTNSGKTYNALQRFKGASSGVYCGPLRLLAMEVFDSVNADGVYCSLTTGQEKKLVPFANHMSCTVEMVSLQIPWDVVVIDEIQMLADEYRGWAWTRALLGVQAKEIHVCGDPSALRLVRDLCACTGDELEEHSYDRFEPLSIDYTSLDGKYTNIQPGDCIVTFSRKDIFSIKRAVELCTLNRCCVIYGTLPPETRTHQAKLFNDPNSGYDVLVATDAVGMGLNLNIRRVIFYTFEKYNGDMKVHVPSSQVKQIAGRAGRRGTIYPVGIATTFYSADIPYLVQCMEKPFEEVPSAGLFPTFDQIELFASQLPEATFAKLLDRFAETCQVDGSFFLCRNDNLKKVASVIDKVKGLTIEERMSFILAPVNNRDAKVVGALLSFALAYSKKVPVHISMAAPRDSATSVLQLMDLEARYQVLSLYLWLSQHFPEEYFPQTSQAGQLATDIALLLGESLVQSGIQVGCEDNRGKGNKRVVNTRRWPLHLPAMCAY